jgi:hypothetical protein
MVSKNKVFGALKNNIEKQELEKQIPVKDLVAELRFKEQIDLLVKKFHQTAIDKKFNLQNVFKDFLENDFVKYSINRSFNETCYKKLESFSKEQKQNPVAFAKRQKVAMLEATVRNSSVFKIFSNLFFQPLESSRLLPSIKREGSIAVNWKMHLLEMEQYFEEYLMKEYLKSKGAVIKNNHVGRSKQI